MDRNILSGSRVVELGAGPGLPALFAAATGAHACITDLSKVVPLIDHNIRANAHAIRRVAPPPPRGPHADVGAADASSEGPHRAAAAHCADLQRERVARGAPDSRSCWETGADIGAATGGAEEGAPGDGTARAHGPVDVPASQDTVQRQRQCESARAKGGPSGGGGRQHSSGRGQQRRQQCDSATRRRPDVPGRPNIRRSMPVAGDQPMPQGTGFSDADVSLPACTRMSCRTCGVKRSRPCEYVPVCVAQQLAFPR